MPFDPDASRMIESARLDQAGTHRLTISLRLGGSGRDVDVTDWCRHDKRCSDALLRFNATVWSAMDAARPILRPEDV